MPISQDNQNIAKQILEKTTEPYSEYNKLNDSDKSEVIQFLSAVLFGQQSSFWRAKMIESSISIEMNLSQLLSAYFVKESDGKFPILNSMIFDRMNTSTKMKHIIHLLKRHHEKVYAKYKGNLNIISDLIKLRNELTHSLISVTDDNYGNYIRHATKVLNENKNIEELEYFYISFYDKDTFQTKKILFSDIKKSIDKLDKENQIIIEIKNKIAHH